MAGENIQQLEAEHLRKQQEKKAHERKLASLKNQGVALMKQFLETGQSKEKLVARGFDPEYIEAAEREMEKENSKEAKIEKTRREARNLTKEAVEKKRMEEIKRRAEQIGAHDALIDFKFKNLSHGEQLLVLEQLSQNTVMHVREEGEKRFRQKMAN